jgi:membrane protein YqaA with SNARE-associated domain
MYDWTLRCAGHRRAPWFLAGLSFAESSFFPVPPDVMLAPMVLARPRKAWQLALITTVFSVLGGLAGYLIGVFALELVEPLIVDAGYQGAYDKAQDWFRTWGFWVVFLAGFSPIPYKIFTITAGAMIVPLLPFVVASLIGRGARFALVAGLVAWGGPRFEPWLRQYIDWIGWGIVLLCAVAALVYVLL